MKPTFSSPPKPPQQDAASERTVPVRSVPLRGRFWVVHAIVPAILFAAAAALFELTPLDEAIADHFYDFGAGSWPLKNDWWLNEVLHDGGRLFVALVGLPILLTGLGAFRSARIGAWRRPAIYVFLAMAIGSGSVRLWQETSDRPCPRDVDRYGGELPHLGLLERMPPGLPPGRCFPAKHSSLGFSLTALYFGLLAARPRASRVALLTGLGVGAVFSVVQLARGAHFLSHSLWSLGICWTAELVLYAGMARPLGWDVPDPPAPSE